MVVVLFRAACLAAFPVTGLDITTALSELETAGGVALAGNLLTPVFLKLGPLCTGVLKDKAGVDGVPGLGLLREGTLLLRMARTLVAPTDA
jgi:hypothetical protein